MHLTGPQYGALALFSALLVMSVLGIYFRPARALYQVPGLLYAMHGIFYYVTVGTSTQIFGVSFQDWSVALRIHGVMTAIIFLLAILLMPVLTVTSSKE